MSVVDEFESQNEINSSQIELETSVRFYIVGVRVYTTFFNFRRATIVFDLH